MNPKYDLLFGKLRNVNVDVDDTVRRFVENDDLYVQFLGNYANEERFPAIYSALESKDKQQLIMLVHKLKGASVNLGMNKISDEAENVIKILKNDSYENVDNMLHSIENTYNGIVDIIKANMPV